MSGWFDVAGSAERIRRQIASEAPNLDGWVIRINGADTKYGTAGFDSMMLAVPERWYGEAEGSRALLAQVAAAEMRALSEAGAARLGERLHHADWVITDDPERVELLGMAHGCPTCREQTDAALAWLRDHPGGEIAAGLLYWSATRPPSSGGVVEVDGKRGMYRRPGSPG